MTSAVGPALAAALSEARAVAAGASRTMFVVSHQRYVLFTAAPRGSLALLKAAGGAAEGFCLVAAVDPDGEVRLGESMTDEERGLL